MRAAETSRASAALVEALVAAAPEALGPHAVAAACVPALAAVAGRLLDVLGEKRRAEDWVLVGGDGLAAAVAAARGALLDPDEPRRAAGEGIGPYVHPRRAVRFRVAGAEERAIGGVYAAMDDHTLCGLPVWRHEHGTHHLICLSKEIMSEIAAGAGGVPVSMWALIADSDDLLNADVSEWLKAMTFADMDLGDDEGVRKFLGAEAKDLLEASESPASHATPWMRFDADDVNEDAFSRSTCDECYDATLWRSFVLCDDPASRALCHRGV